jgi:HrpA-like RNA helicase
MIDQLLSKAEEQQQEFDINDKDYNDSDDERVLDVLQEHALQELRAQKSEFQSAINCLTTELNSILLSTIGDRYDVVRLQRIQKQLERELKRWQSRLPIYAKRSDIIEKLRRNQILILKADTGSGKSTQIVQYLCDEHFADQSIFILYSDFNL